MTLKWRRDVSGHVADPVSTPWHRNIVYEIYPADHRTYGRHHWAVLKHVGGGPRYALGPVQKPLAAAKAHAEHDLAEEKDWLLKAFVLQKLLFERTGCKWELRKGRGTSAYNIYVSSPPERKQDRFGNLMTFADRQLLAAAFAMPPELVGSDMVMIRPEQYDSYLIKLKRE